MGRTQARNQLLFSILFRRATPAKKVAHLTLKIDLLTSAHIVQITPHKCAEDHLPEDSRLHQKDNSNWQHQVHHLLFNSLHLRFWKLLHLFSMHVCFYTGVHMSLMVCKGQRTICGSCFCLSTMYVLGIKCFYLLHHLLAPEFKIFFKDTLRT